MESYQGLVFFLILIVVWLVKRYIEKGRAPALDQVASHIGLARGVTGYPLRFFTDGRLGFQVYEQAQRRHSWNPMTVARIVDCENTYLKQELDGTFVVSDLRYEPRFNFLDPARVTVGIMVASQTSFPPFLLRRRPYHHTPLVDSTMTTIEGNTALTIPDVEPFSKSFLLETPKPEQEEEIRLFFHAKRCRAIADFFEQALRTGGRGYLAQRFLSTTKVTPHLEGRGSALIYHIGMLIAPEDYESFLVDTTRLFALFSERCD